MTSKPKSALIGHTGFVGSNLARDIGDFEGYNSTNFRELRGQHFDLIICSGVQAVKWWANQNPDADWAGISELLDVLETVTCDALILISTVDVYKSPVGVDEKTPIKLEGLHPYGLHRWRVEEFIRTHFENNWIVRLPGLFGAGLKKNLIFDMMNNRPIDGFDARSSFQFYNLARLAKDLEAIRNSVPGTYNIAIEPVRVADVVETITGTAYSHQTDAPPIHYDMRSHRTDVWGKSGDYIMKADEVMNDIKAFSGAAALLHKSCRGFTA